MALGLALNAVSLFLFTQVQATSSYSSIWPLLTMAGIGMAMVMPTMTAAVMGSVPPARAGMASATSNASREIGGVFGIALLGAIVTHVFSQDLSKAVAGLGLPQSLRDLIVKQAGQGAEQAAAGKLPPGVNVAALHSAVANSFVSGMHVAMLVAACLLLFGSATALVMVRSGRPEQRFAPSPAVASEIPATEGGA
jgi:hypothetical protein